MSVIAKMSVQSSGSVPSGALIRLGCVYDTDLGKEENEDVRFTKATPWGEATMEVKQGLQEGSSWYLIFDEDVEPADISDGSMALKVRCHAIHDYGTSKQIEISTAYDQVGVPENKLTVRSKHPSFHLKMAIDNPGASIQFVPNATYFMSMWNAGQFSMTEAIRMARRKVEA